MTTRTLMTVAEFEKLPDDGNLHELHEGELIVMPPPRPRHGRVQRAVAVLLDKATRDAGSGIVLTECGFRLAPDVVQARDVAFIREERQAEIAWDRYCEFGPDLAVEILSPDDNAARLAAEDPQVFRGGHQRCLGAGPRFPHRHRVRETRRVPNFDCRRLD